MKRILVVLILVLTVGGFVVAQDSALSEAEEQSLAFMREEEKLARDVYQAMYDLWGLRVFTNIAGSEQQHMDSVLTLIERYGLEDPVIAPGRFSDPELQQLYDDLVARGSESVEEALMVGALIEEVDIIDLDEAIADTSQEDIRFVYESLRAGSENHLRAFVSQLGDYEPQLVDEAVYEAIVGSDGRGGPSAGRRVADDQRGGGYRGGRR